MLAASAANNWSEQLSARRMKCAVFRYLDLRAKTFRRLDRLSRATNRRRDAVLRIPHGAQAELGVGVGGPHARTSSKAHWQMRGKLGNFGALVILPSWSLPTISGQLTNRVPTLARTQIHTLRGGHASVCPAPGHGEREGACSYDSVRRYGDSSFNILPVQLWLFTSGCSLLASPVR